MVQLSGTVCQILGILKLIMVQPAILNFIKVAYPNQKQHILFYSNTLAIWHSIWLFCLRDAEVRKVKGYHPQKAHQHPLRDVCVQYNFFF